MDEDIKTHIFLPINSDDYYALRHTLIEADVLVTGNYSDSGNFDLGEYISAGRLGDVKFRALYDQNMISPLTTLASGGKIDDKNSRIACAAAAFCIITDILIEPGISTHEYASKNGNSAAHKKAKLFRIADNQNPHALIDIALGRVDQLPKFDILRAEEIISDIPADADFNRPMRLWKPNYLFTLKTATLRRRGLSPIDSAVELLRWQSEDSFYNAAASMYCMAAVSHQPPKGGMLKGIASSNISKLSDGLRNATWDICIIQQFSKYSGEVGDPSWSFWSHDVATREIAKMLLARDGMSAEEAQENYYARCWGKDGPYMHRAYQAGLSRTNAASKARENKISAAFSKIDADIAALEAELGISLG